MRKNQSFWLVALCIFSLGIWGISRTSAATVAPLSIDQGHTRTATRHVTLKITAPRESRLMKISNTDDFEDAQWQKIERNRPWTLPYGVGQKRVYIKFLDNHGKTSGPYSDTIFLSLPKKFDSQFEIQDGADETTSRAVELNFEFSSGIEELEISNTSNFSDSENFLPDPSLLWTLSPEAGEKTVYVKFIDVDGKSHILSDSITYNAPPRSIEEGTVVKGQSATMYYMGIDGKMHPFFDIATYHSWYKDFSKVVYVSDAKIQEYNIGTPVCLRAGTWLVKFSGQARVYAVEPGCRLRPLRSETEAFIFYGETWQKRIIELSEVLKNFYTTSDITSYESEEDHDRDGVDEETEQLYNTSEKRADSDQDGISDYEEIYFWFSDPISNDTNKNGVTDGMEIRKGLSPLTSAPLSVLPEGSYPLPLGTVFQTPNGRGNYYYQYTSDQAGTLNANTFKTYNAPMTFVSRTPFSFVFPKRSSYRSSNVLKIHFTPNIYHGKVLREL